jgi:hypothetical protein
MFALILLVLAFVSFVLAIFIPQTPARFNLKALGLAAWVLAVIVQSYTKLH